MRWGDFRRSDNIEDRRDEGAGPGGSGLPFGVGRLGIGGVVVLALVGWALGIDPMYLIGNALNDGPQQAPPAAARKTATPTDQMGQFVAAVLGDTEDRWKDIFQKSNQRYQAPILVMFNRTTDAPCGGVARSATGPFYCPSDRKIYIDTSFFADLQTKFHGCNGKACQFSQAYVISHEVGHHVQNLLGILPKVQQMQRGLAKAEANHLQVKVELQADCFAGVWAHHAQEKLKFIELGDVEAAMQTASAIGDDRLQRMAQGDRPGAGIVPDAFTHGTSAQRVRWFTNGLKAGTVSSCNTFSAPAL